MSILTFQRKTKPSPIVTRAMYYQQRYEESLEDLKAARAALQLRLDQAIAAGEADEELMAVARQSLADADAAITGDDIACEPLA